MKIIKLVLSIIVIVLSVYSLITKNFGVTPYMMFFLGAFMLVIGLSELQKDRKRVGVINIIVALLIFYVSFQGFLMR